MTKKTNLLVQVECNRGAPISFSGEKRRLEKISEILDSWREIGAWWAKEPERQVYLIVTASQKSYELCHELPTDRWYLSRIFD